MPSIPFSSGINPIYCAEEFRKVIQAWLSGQLDMNTPRYSVKPGVLGLEHATPWMPLSLIMMMDSQDIEGVLRSMATAGDPYLSQAIIVLEVYAGLSTTQDLSRAMGNAHCLVADNSVVEARDEFMRRLLNRQSS